MSNYTTGEIAKLCGVTVRTVQYYDSRNILVPSQLSEGGRRLYSEDDLKRMRIICFLREAGLPINSISALFAEENARNIISVILEQQEQTLRTELDEKQKQLQIINTIQSEMKELEQFSVESIGDIAHVMKDKKALKKLRTIAVVSGIPVTALLWTSVILWITNGIWWLFGLWAVTAVAWGIWVAIYYFTHVQYICPECHEIFRPDFKEAFWAYHTPKMRRLTCPKCGKKSLCIEVYAEKENHNND